VAKWHRQNEARSCDTSTGHIRCASTVVVYMHIVLSVTQFSTWALVITLLVWMVVIKQLYKDISSCANSEEAGRADFLTEGPNVAS